MEYQERAERAICQLEPLPVDGRHRFWRADRLARSVFPRHSALARRRQSWSISGSPDQPERDVQHEYMPPRFLVDREAMDARTNYRPRGPVRGSGFLWRRALRSVLHLRAD